MAVVAANGASVTLDGDHGGKTGAESDGWRLPVGTKTILVVGRCKNLLPRPCDLLDLTELDFT